MRCKDSQSGSADRTGADGVSHASDASAAVQLQAHLVSVATVG